MKNYEGINFDALYIERAFGKVLEFEDDCRGGINDADVFREGKIKDLGLLMEKTIEKLEVKINCNELNNESNKRSLEFLKTISEDMKVSSEIEGEDYHWLIIGDLFKIIFNLL